jgi:hypothetical protein
VSFILTPKERSLSNSLTRRLARFDVNEKRLLCGLIGADSRPSLWVFLSRRAGGGARHRPAALKSYSLTPCSVLLDCEPPSHFLGQNAGWICEASPSPKEYPWPRQPVESRPDQTAKGVGRSFCLCLPLSGWRIFCLLQLPDNIFPVPRRPTA